jgi:hypothetical protein
MNNSFDDDYRFVFAKTGKPRGPRTTDDQARPGGTSGGGGTAAQRKTLLEAIKRKPQVMVKITSFGKSGSAVARHLDYISRNGKNDVFDAMGDNLREVAEQQDADPRDVLQAQGERLATGQIGRDGADKKEKGRPRERVTMNLMLSMPPGTDTGGFELAVRDFLSVQFRSHDHVFTFHDDKDHYHSHVVVKLQGDDGRWLNPRKADILEWRENFAASLERRGIEAQAMPTYSQGKGKGGYRRDIEETRKRGTRRRADRSPRYDAETEGQAIEQRAKAWTRISEHYRGRGDADAADAIKSYVADRFDHHPDPAPIPPVTITEPAAAQKPAPEPDTGRER